MPKFEVTYSVNALYSQIVDAVDKEEAISIVNGDPEGNLFDEEYLGINIVRDVTHEYTEDSKPEAKNPLKANRAE